MNIMKTLAITASFLEAIVLFITPSLIAEDSEVESVKIPQAAISPQTKIDSRLTERMQSMRSDDTVSVGVWFFIPDYDSIARQYLADIDSDEAESTFTFILTTKIAEAGLPVIQFLADSRFTPSYVSIYAPLILVLATPPMVQSLANYEDIEAIYITGECEPACEHAAKTDRADVVWARGYSGNATDKIAVIEIPEQSDASRIRRPNPYLSGGNLAFRPTGTVSNHATWVALRIAALCNPPDRWRGIAPGIAPLLSANSLSNQDKDIIEATEWAMAEKARILNCSFSDLNFDGTPNNLTKYYDWVVFNYNRIVTIGAGNRGYNDGHIVGHPGLSYNSICVGAYEDNDDNKWSDPDDVISSFSSFRDPPKAIPPVGQDRGLPHVVAVGESIELPEINGTPSAPQDGTSLAAPAVAGIAALICERKPTLTTYPHVIRAIIMAGACHNIEGESRFSDKDGAGAVVACEADEIVQKENYHHKSLRDSDFNGPAPNGVWSYKAAYLVKSLKARVVISWLVAVGGDDGYTYPAGGPLLSDLDLRVYSPGNDATPVASSISYDNNFEIVEFTPSESGYYRIEVRRMTWNEDANNPLWVKLGIAWTQEPCCSPDWGDAPDDMLHCWPRPKHGDFPSLQKSDGANAREYEVEWLSRDNTNPAGATWELDANVDPYEKERDQDQISNIKPATCETDHDAEDDGVKPALAYIAGTKGRVTFWVNSATPNVGRYVGGDPDEKIYVNGSFDWEHDDKTWVSNLMVSWRGGPGLVGDMPIGNCIKGCNLWNVNQNQVEVEAEFDVPPNLPTGPFWIRFRLDYGQNRGGETDTATYGEVEDHISYQFSIPLYIDVPPNGPPPWTVIHNPAGWRPPQGSPIGTDWVEIFPNYGEPWRMESWRDNGSGQLDECDTVDVRHKVTGLKRWRHVAKVTTTLLVTSSIDSTYLEFIGYNPDVEPISQPESTYWHEVHPVFGKVYRCESWEDKNANGNLDDLDSIGLFSFSAPDSGQAKMYRVENERTDLIVERLKPKIKIEKTHNALQGQYEYVSIIMESYPIEMGGFDFLIAYDASALTFIEALAGQLLADCDWEYFTYRRGAYGNCGDACPSGLLRIVAMAETNNGPNHPLCYGSHDTDPHELARLKFYITDDRTYECQFVPIRFFWGDCGDNTISNVSGDSLYISDHVYNFEGNEVTGDVYYGGYSWIGDCQNPDTTKPSPTAIIDFVHGGIDIVCADSIDLRGDINLNNTANEIADAVLFTNFFIYGFSVFNINPPGQIAATDTNNDGRVLTVGDLTYLIRIITGDAMPFSKLKTNAENAYVGILVNHTAATVSCNSRVDIGGAQFVIRYNGYEIGEPHLINGASNMISKFNDENGVLKILIYSMKKDMKISAGTENIFIIPISGKGSIEITEAQMSDYYGNMLNTDIAKETTLPRQFALHQNYPNPFNATTQIIYELPSATHVKIEIFNILGQKVTTLLDKEEIAGVHRIEWNATDNLGNEVASGPYLYRLSTKDFTAEKKMMLVK